MQAAARLIYMRPALCIKQRGRQEAASAECDMTSSQLDEKIHNGLWACGDAFMHPVMEDGGWWRGRGEPCEHIVKTQTLVALLTRKEGFSAKQPP